MSIAKKSLDEFFSGMPTGSMERAILNNLTTLNFLQTPNALPSNKDMPGYIFLTRPQLNMQKDNIRNVRQMAQLLNNNPVSVQKYIRCLLDPRLALGLYYDEKNIIPPDPCPIIDNSMAFITPYTNNAISCSGWPSIAAPTYRSEAGLYNESQTIIDGRVLNSESFDLTVNFKNTRGDVILFSLYIWVLYASMVFEGKLIPYLDFISENEIDYNTRIYRIVTDYTRTRVTKIYCCNAAIPVGVPVGDAADIPGDKVYSDANDTLSVRFACDGFRCFDDRIALEFNDVTRIFKPEMSDGSRDQYMERIPPALMKVFNFRRAYPRINLSTAELEWWTDRSLFNQVASQYVDLLSETNSELYEGD